MRSVFANREFFSKQVSSSFKRFSSTVQALNRQQNTEQPVLDAKTRFVTPAEYRQRQKRLVSLVNEFAHQGRKTSALLRHKRHLLLINSTRPVTLTDTPIPSPHFKQNSDFMYFTGLNTRDSTSATLVLLFDESSSEDVEVKSFESRLLAPKSNELKIVWEGEGLHSRHYLNYLSPIVDSVESAENLIEILQAESERANILVTRYPPPPNVKIDRSTAFQLSSFIDRLRIFKSPAEIAAIKRTCQIGSRALKTAILSSSLESTPFEGDIAAIFESEARRLGAQRLAYPTVCAGADRSAQIHYGSNDRRLDVGDWILMDAGVEDVDGYNSDLTRSWQVPCIDETPARSQLTLQLYQALVEVHSKLAATVASKIGEISANDLYQVMCEYLGELLVEFNLVKNEQDGIQMADQICPHHVSHYLGLDVHDTATFGRDAKIVDGMCFTIEPGLYFRSSIPNIPKEFQGIGLRVEDDFIVESSQLINLTESCSWIAK